MRSLVLAITIMVAISSAGCFRYFDIHGCGGNASWVEPGLAGWIAANGFENGFGPPVNATGRIESLLPANMTLHYTFRSSQIAENKVTFGTTGTLSDLHVERPPGAPRVAIEMLLTFLDETLDSVYRGDDESRQAAAAQIRKDSWLLNEADSGIFFRLQNKWSFDAVLDENASFTPSTDGATQEMRTKGWFFAATQPEWRRLKETVRDPHVSLMVVSLQDQVEIEFFYLDEEQETKDLVRREIPQFDWAFEGFSFESGCPSPY